MKLATNTHQQFVRAKAVAEPEQSRFARLSFMLREAATQNSTADQIANDLMLEWLSQFLAKNADYGDWEENGLGLRGEFVELHRKVMKLKHSVWNGNEVKGEQPREILLDMIGHCFLAIKAIDGERNADQEMVLLHE